MFCVLFFLPSPYHALEILIDTVTNHSTNDSLASAAHVCMDYIIYATVLLNFTVFPSLTMHIDGAKTGETSWEINAK